MLLWLTTCNYLFGLADFRTADGNRSTVVRAGNINLREVVGYRNPFAVRSIIRRMIDIDVELQISNLVNEPHHLPQLAHWHHRQWGYLNPLLTESGRAAKMQAYLKPDLLPTTLVGTCDGVLVGSAALVTCDMDSHPELSPWLASVYVDERWRRCGIGRELVRAVMLLARAGGYDELYLFTDGQQGFYELLGWSELNSEIYREIPVTIMHVAL